MLRIRRASPFALALVLLTTSLAAAQALPSLASVSVNYATQKRKVQPAGDLRAQIDVLDREIAEATRLGRTGELRRLYAKGLALLGGQPWTPTVEFARSLVVRTDRLITDPATPWLGRLEQIFSPSLALERALVVRTSIRTPAVAASATAPARPAETVKEFPERDGVGRDLRESPLTLALDLGGLADGRYQVAVQVLDGTTTLGTVVQPIVIQNGLTAAIERLTQAAGKAPESVRTSILFPIDRIALINRGDAPLGAFAPAAELAAADRLARESAGGRDPLAGRTGDFTRHYRLASAGEIMPYRLYVPTTYAKSRLHAVVIALHGLGGDENSLFTAYGGALQKLGEQHGFIVVSPLGYRPDGWYGWDGFINRDDPGARRSIERSEEDVLQVLQQVRALYTIDDARVYLMGHSMGGIGTWHLAQKYPDTWAAIGPIAGIAAPETAGRMRHIPQFVVHGDADLTVDVRYSREMVAALKQAGATVTYVEVAGGDHVNIAVPNLPAMFAFFAERRRVP